MTVSTAAVGPVSHWSVTDGPVLAATGLEDPVLVVAVIVAVVAAILAAGRLFEWVFDYFAPPEDDWKEE